MMEHTVDDHIAKGFDRRIAEYYSSGRKRITGVVPNDDFTLSITFDNEENRVLDMIPIMQPGTVFAPLAELRNFRRVYLDENHVICWDIDPGVDSNIVWSNRVDLCPDQCYLDSIPVAEE